MKKNKILLAISALLLSSGLLMGSASESSSKPDNDGGVFICEDTGEEGPMFYAADYSTDITNEPNYSTQNSYTFSTMGFNNAPQEYRGDSVKVAVIDSGLNYTHEDFADTNGNQIIQGNSRTIDNTSGGWLYYQFSSGYQSKIVDSLGHGTNVASVIASQINALGCAGIAPNVELYIYKVTNTNNGYEWTAINSALSYCISEGIDVINMSFQAYENDVTYNGSTMPASKNCSTQLTNYINSCYDAGITLVAAAGNYNTSEPSYPASNNHVISVGSLAESSSYIKAGYSNTYGIDLVAPGTVYVADKGTNSAYRKNSGTSFSAPIVTAAIALYKQQNPSATPAQIESALYASCDTISGSPAWAGNGRLNIDKFLGVESVGPTNIVVNNPEVINDELELEVGDTLDLDWTVNGVGTFDESVTFSTYSETEDIVSVSSSGKITAVGEGEDFVYITSTIDDSVYAAIDVTVTTTAASPTVSSVSISPSSLSLDLNGTTTGQLSATVNGTNNPSQTVTWTSSNTSKATVSATGLVTAVGTGTVSIYATSTVDDTKYGTATVTITDSSSKPSINDYNVSSTRLTSSTITNGSYVVWGTSTTNLATSISSNWVYLGSTSTKWIIFKIEGTSSGFRLKNTSDNTYVYSSAEKKVEFNNTGLVYTLDSNDRLYNSNVGSYVLNSTGLRPYKSGSYTAAYLYPLVAKKTLSSISINTQPTKTSYESGEYFDPTGLVITRTYSDSTSDTYSYSNHATEFSFNPSLTTGLTTGNTTIEITYSNKTCTQNITVTQGIELSSISIANYSTSFVEGDAFSFGGTVTAHYNDSSTTIVTGEATFSGYNMATVGNQTVIVSYTYKNVNKTQSYSINVNAGTLNSIDVAGQTTVYTKNATFAFDGTCTATFANGYQKVVAPTSVSSPDMTSGGVKTVTVSYSYNGKTETVNYNITVNAYREVIETVTTSVYCTYDFSSISGTSEITSTTTLQSCYSSTGGITGVNVSSRSKTYAKNGFVRLATGSASGSITFGMGTAEITSIEIKAKGWSSSEQNCTMSITGGGSITTSSDTVVDTFNVDISGKPSSITLSASSNHRICIQSVKFVSSTSTSQDIGQSEDCVGLETFISTYMHMDYVENLGYCSDSVHHYYSTAKTAFNALNTHQRSLFTGNSAYLTEWTRLSTWASKNGDSLNGSNQLASVPNQQVLKVIQTNSAELVVIMVASIITLSAVGGYFFIRRRKEL